MLKPLKCQQKRLRSFPLPPSCFSGLCGRCQFHQAAGSSHSQCDDGAGWYLLSYRCVKGVKLSVKYLRFCWDGLGMQRMRVSIRAWEVRCLFPFSLGQTEMLWGTSCTRLELPQAAEAGRAELLLIYPDSIIASCFQEFACACRCRHRKEVASFKLGRKKKKTHNKTPFLKTICREPSMLLTPLIMQLFLILFWHLCWN